MVVCQWKPKDGVKPENWTFGLICQGARICAIDIQPLTHHTNRVGRDRPLFQQRIRGNHVHSWSPEGYGYAEPLTLTPIDGKIAWSAFSKLAGIIEIPFTHPDKAINQGQQELGL